jgi:hypothetical protein
MAEAIPVMMLAGTAISAMGAMSQANAQVASSNFNAQINQRNATLATQQATVEAERVARQGELAQGRMRAALGASGLTVDGSALDALADSAAQAQLDVETVKYRGRLAAMGYHDNVALDRLAGRTAREQGTLRTASEVLTGVGRAGATYAAGARRIEGTNTYTG